MFKPDRPIFQQSDDLLGRADFARAFGRAILSYTEKESIVTAIYGDWGSGKSSVLNMTLEYVVRQTENIVKDEKPIIIKFNPWNYSDQSHLIALFFKELSFALRREDYGGEAKKVGDKLEAYANFFTPLALIPDPTVSMLSLIYQKVFSGVGKAANAWGAAYSKDLEATRNELNDLLANQNRKILIVIDDIDRLNNDEIRQIFQLVKMLGDFPNTIYVLAFDQGVVTKALEKVQEGPGDDYLEKIVQFPAQLPPISKPELEKLFFSLLDELIREIPEERWDGTYWGNIYHSGIKPYFNTIRDVTRYINSLKFSFEMVRNEVNPVDFIAITVVQVFEPALFEGIRGNKELFSGVMRNGSISSESQEKQMLARTDEILSRAKHLDKGELIDFLSRLFPRLESLYDKMGYGADWLSSWRKDARICSPDNFDTYFLLSVPEGEIPKSEIQTILNLAADKEEFKNALIDIASSKKIIRFLELFEDYTEEDIPVENMPNIIEVLMDIGDQFPESNGGFFGFDTPTKILRIFRQLSLRLNKQEERYILFSDAIRKAENSIYTIVYKVGLLSDEHGKGLEKSDEKLKPEEEREISKEQAEKLAALAVQKIEKWAKEGKLNTHPRLISILYCWERWNKDNKSVAKEFVESLVKSDEGLINFLSAISHKTQSHSVNDLVATTNLKINLKNVGDFTDVEKIEARVRALVKSDEFQEFTPDEKKVLSVFLDTYDGKVEDW